MGIKVMTKVWEWSQSSGTELLVLLALADHSDDDGVCYPGVARIAKKARTSERTVQRCFKSLQEMGELLIERGEGLATNGGKTNRFCLKFRGGDKLSGGDNSGKKVVTSDAKGGDTAMSPKSSVESSVESSVGNEVLKEWNKTALTKCLKLTPKRKIHLKNRMESKFWRENWIKGLEIIASSPFCCGQNDHRWTADIDWFIRSDDAVAKALEGKYGSISAKVTMHAPEPPVIKQRST